MKKITILFIAASLVLAIGCRHRARTPKTYTYKEVVPPQTAEGKKCYQTCKQLNMQCKQLANSEYLADRAEHGNDKILKDLDGIGKDIALTKCKEEYHECVVDCGGKIETRTRTY